MAAGAIGGRFVGTAAAEFKPCQDGFFLRTGKQPPETRQRVGLQGPFRREILLELRLREWHHAAEFVTEKQCLFREEAVRTLGQRRDRAEAGLGIRIDSVHLAGSVPDRLLNSFEQLMQRGLQDGDIGVAQTVRAMPDNAYAKNQTWPERASRGHVASLVFTDAAAVALTRA
jgi:hypothetical protein